MALIKRDLLILFRNPRGWLAGLVFFVLFLSLIAIAIDADPQKMADMAAPGILLAVIFSLLLMFESLFQADMRSGISEQMLLSGLTPLSIAFSKFISSFIVTVLPLVVITPLVGLMYQIDFQAVGPIMLSLLIGTPGLIAMGMVSAAILSGQRTGGFLIILLTLPFLVPVLIFGLAGIESYPEKGLWNSGFLALAGVSLISLGIGLPASAAAFKANME